MKTITKLKKQKSHAFGKDVYLLGEDQEGVRYWLEAPKWDCGWYWGFGYIETYTNNKHPDLARDINSHSHWERLVGKQEYYDHEKGCHRLSNDYIYHLNDNPNFINTVLTDSESWKLADLMKTFYTLKATAELYHSGSSHLSSPKLSLKDKKEEDRINKELLPLVFKEIISILSPKEELEQ